MTKRISTHLRKRKARAPETYQRIPRSGAQADAIVADTQAAYAVLVTAQGAHLVTSEHIPHLSSCQSAVQISEEVMQMAVAYLALKVIVTRKKQSSGNRKGDRCDTAENLIALVNLLALHDWSTRREITW